MRKLMIQKKALIIHALYFSFWQVLHIVDEKGQLSEIFYMSSWKQKLVFFVYLTDLTSQLVLSIFDKF